MSRSQWLALQMSFSLSRRKVRPEKRIPLAQRVWRFTLPDGSQREIDALPFGTTVQAA